MDRSLHFTTVAIAAALLIACGDPATNADAGMDSGPIVSDAGRDANRPDTGPPDSGVQPCTVGCEFVELALGDSHTCARRANGEIWCWGRDLEGQLGDGPARQTTCGVTGG